MGANADLAGVVGIGIAAPFLERGDHVSSGGAVVLHARDAKLDHMADVPKAGAFVHVLVKPLPTDREVELRHQVGELGVERPEQARGAVEELEGHEGVGREGTVEVVEAMGEEAEETIDRAGRRLHGGEGSSEDEHTRRRCSWHQDWDTFVLLLRNPTTALPHSSATSSLSEEQCMAMPSPVHLWVKCSCSCRQASDIAAPQTQRLQQEEGEKLPLVTEEHLRRKETEKKVVKGGRGAQST
ncbi:hypothetical protein C4D60_Mb11t16560 [Musa balbisiana]|uniref:Uncharacterized protein n=1 Tax=Musa balbisiana TaxID=52838 RepID=A0A4S8J4K7_MUSBA|nr:hypothetical protein C4D60_Mb11t16560 [Musa balbisiana]